MRKIIAWTLYDFANSSYSAVIAAVVFPVYYATVIVGNSEGLGDLWWGRAMSLSMFLVAATSPFVGGIADISGRRKSFLFVYTFIAILSVALLATLKQGMILYGFVLAVIANVCVEGGLVFYNAFLPLIALRGNVGKISAAGFAMGYLGSIVSLLAALYFLRMNMISLVWIQVAVFFSLFSIPVFVYMPSDIPKSGVIASARKGFVQSFETIKLLLSGRESRFFLLAYFLYTDGVNTVIVFSSIFAVTTLGFNKYEVIGLFLIVQISAFIGSFAISYPIDRWGPLRVVRMSIVVWILATVGAFFAKSKGEFYFIAILAGFVLGTVQAGSRALYTFFIPKERESEFFGVYSTVGKTSSILGPLLFGILSASFKNQRPAVLSISLLFVFGFILLTGVRKINY